jgi:hypothetical protein
MLHDASQIVRRVAVMEADYTDVDYQTDLVQNGGLYGYGRAELEVK